jgi:hypothetical protein
MYHPGMRPYRPMPPTSGYYPPYIPGMMPIRGMPPPPFMYAPPPQQELRERYVYSHYLILDNGNDPLNQQMMHTIEK